MLCLAGYFCLYMCCDWPLLYFNVTFLRLTHHLSLLCWPCCLGLHLSLLRSPTSLDLLRRIQAQIQVGSATTAHASHLLLQHCLKLALFLSQSSSCLPPLLPHQSLAFAARSWSPHMSASAPMAHVEHMFPQGQASGHPYGQEPPHPYEPGVHTC